MKATYIDYRDTNSFSKTLIAYLDNHPELQPFLETDLIWMVLQSKLNTKRLSHTDLCWSINCRLNIQDCLLMLLP